MDDRLKKRILLFYIAGIINAFLGLYVFFEGATVLQRDTATWLVIFFLSFAAVDFYFPYAIKKKWEEEQARRRAGEGGTSDEVGSQK